MSTWNRECVAAAAFTLMPNLMLRLRPAPVEFCSCKKSDVKCVIICGCDDETRVMLNVVVTLFRVLDLIGFTSSDQSDLTDSTQDTLIYNYYVSTKST